MPKAQISPNSQLIPLHLKGGGKKDKYHQHLNDDVSELITKNFKFSSKKKQFFFWISEVYTQVCF